MAVSRELSLVESLRARHWVAYTEREQRPPFQSRVVVARADQSEQRVLFTGRERSVNCPLAWHPNGRVIYHSHDQIYAIDVASGEARAVTRFSEEDLFSAHWLLQCSPDGERLLYQRSVPAGGEGRPRSVISLCTVGTDGSDHQVLVPPQEDLFLWRADALWSRNLLLLAFTTKSLASELWIADLSQPEDRRLLGALPESPHDVRLSPRGDQVAYSDRRGLWTLEITSGKRRRVAKFGCCPAWSPDGASIAFVRDDCELWMADIDSRSLRRLAWVKGGRVSAKTRRGGYAVPPVWSSDGRLLWLRLAEWCRRRPSREEIRWARELDVSEEEREEFGTSEEELQGIRGDAIESLRWDVALGDCILDWSGNAACVTGGKWDSVAWSPVSDVDNA